MTERSTSSLETYQSKRNFSRTPEPDGDDASEGTQLLYVVQKHAASQLHYDFRLQLTGVLKSWAVPKGPSLDPQVRSLAIHVEDHPLDYGSFEGIIPEDEYGGGTVMLWDRGTWHPKGDPLEAYQKGRLTFDVSGEKLNGRWALFRMSNGKDDHWLLQKGSDAAARPGTERAVLEEYPRSVASGRSLEEIAQSYEAQDTKEVKGTAPLDQLDVPEGAEKGAPTSTVSPQLATRTDHAPTGEDWIHELKLDGYRLLARRDASDVRLLTRNGNDWTDRFPSIARALDWVPKDSVFDGEVVVRRSDGTTDFQALQNYLSSGKDGRLLYYLFDVPFFDNHDLTGVPQKQRKTFLKQVLDSAPQRSALRYSDHIEGQGDDVYQHACRHKLEGVISKHANKPYVQERSTYWLKTKCLERQEFVVCGWSEPSGSRAGFGSLLLAYHDEEGQLTYSGRVGTGFTQTMLQDISERLQHLEQDRPSVVEPPSGAETADVHWVEPKLVAEVEFTAWTDDGKLRHPSFQGLRDDIEPEHVFREDTEKQDPPSTSPSKKTNDMRLEVAGVRLSNPDRVLYSELGLTKHALADYVASIATRMLPFIANRPLTLVRCPRGENEDCFYQKHRDDTMPDAVRGVQVEEKNEKATYVMVDDVAGLVSLVQMGVLELHPWGSRADRLDRPDMLVFDLDPGENVRWDAVVAGAQRVRDVLRELKLKSYVRTSGGKGLHVVVPIDRRSSWAEAKQFAKAVSVAIAASERDRYVTTSSKAERKEKIFIDYLRNSRGATAVASYSPRARPSAPVATPLRWDELSKVESADQYDVSNIPYRLRSLRSDPWADFFDVRQSITKRRMEAIGAK